MALGAAYKYMKNYVLKFLVWVGCCLLSQFVVANAKLSYSLAVVPQYTAIHIHREWAPFVRYMSDKMGIEIKLKVYLSFKDFERELNQGVPDFVYLNPFHQLHAYAKDGYIPLIRDGSRQLVGILVVKRDSGIQSLADLNNMSIVYPSPTAFAASLYMRALLREKEGLSFKSVYANSHSNVYRQVMRNRVVAGGGVINTLQRQPASIKDNLRVLYKTPGVAPHPISAHPRVSAADRQIFIDIVLELAKSDQSDGLLKRIQLTQPVLADQQRDYEHLSELGLDKYLDN